jgi:hypothetical protein
MPCIKERLLDCFFSCIAETLPDNHRKFAPHPLL